MARLLLCFAPMFTGGVDTSYRRTARTSSAPGLDAALESPRPGADEDPASVPTDGAVARLKAHLLWRDEATEREWEQETGWNLLTCACLLDDYAAAMMLLAAPDGRSLVNAYGRAHRHAMRSEPDIPAHHPTTHTSLSLAQPLSIVLLFRTVPCPGHSSAAAGRPIWCPA